MDWTRSTSEVKLIQSYTEYEPVCERLRSCVIGLKINKIKTTGLQATCCRVIPLIK